MNAARWYVIAPEHLSQRLLAEAHSAILSGHLSERKVYDRLLLVVRDESRCEMV